MTKRALTSMAIVLSLLGLVLMFVLDELLIGPRAMFSWESFRGTIGFLAGMGGYAFAGQYLLSHGNRQALHSDWPLVFTLNWAVLVVAAISLLVEPNRGAAFSTLAVALFSLTCSFGGAWVAQRSAHTRTLESAPTGT